MLVGCTISDILTYGYTHGYTERKTTEKMIGSRLGVNAATLKTKAKDLASKAKAEDGVKANVNMVRCSVKTSQHSRIWLVMK